MDANPDPMLQILMARPLFRTNQRLMISEIGTMVPKPYPNPETAAAHPEIAETIKSMIKEDDSLSTELWTIMNVFGPYLSMVTCPFKTVTIELNKNPNFGNQFTTITTNNESEEPSNDN